MNLIKFTRFYIVASVVSTFVVYSLVKFISETTEGSKASISLFDFLVFHGGYILIALAVYQLVLRLRYRGLCIAVLVLLLPLSLLEWGLVFGATDEALAYGYLPLAILRVLCFLAILVFALIHRLLKPYV